jgi:hypothetical protein
MILIPHQLIHQKAGKKFNFTEKLPISLEMDSDTSHDVDKDVNVEIQENKV